MKKEIKYTSDGKKVVVLGSLDESQQIVQEIFVTENGDEIPQGKNFIVSGVYDEPVKSYREVQLQKIEKNYQQRKEEIERHLRDLEARYKIKREGLSDLIACLSDLSKNYNREHLNMLCMFLEGKINFVVYKTYNKVYVSRLIDSIVDKDGTKLLTLLGNSKGELEFRISQYSDGSGNWDKRECNFFNTKEEAQSFAKDMLKSMKISIEVIKQAEEWGVELDKNDVAEFNENRRESYIKSLKEHEQRVKEYKALIDLH